MRERIRIRSEKMHQMMFSQFEGPEFQLFSLAVHLGKTYLMSFFTVTSRKEKYNFKSINRLKMSFKNHLKYSYNEKNFK